ncbi:hypothetical protein Dimus_007985 [Dionaea muscipula]
MWGEVGSISWRKDNCRDWKSSYVSLLILTHSSTLLCIFLIPHNAIISFRCWWREVLGEENKCSVDPKCRREIREEHRRFTDYGLGCLIFAHMLVITYLVGHRIVGVELPY